MTHTSAFDHGTARVHSLVPDPTPLTDRFRVLCVAVLAGGGLPVAWAVQTAD